MKLKIDNMKNPFVEVNKAFEKFNNSCRKMANNGHSIDELTATYKDFSSVSSGTLKVSYKRKIDCKKIKSLEEVKLILDSLNLSIGEECPQYDKLKHLIEDDEEDNKFDIDGIKFTNGRISKHRFMKSLNGYLGVVKEIEEGCNGLIGLKNDNGIRWYPHIDLIILKDYDEWCDINIDDIEIKLAESGADREMCFNIENELYKLYGNYVRSFRGE